MRLSWRRLSCAAVLLLPAAACGKKGPPLAPLLRVPAQVAELSAQRSADAVYLTALVPSTNVGGDAPGDVGGLEVYAATAEREPPLGEGNPGPPWELVQRLRVRRPVPPPPPAKAGAPAVPPLPLEPGVDQGQRVTLREVLTAAHLEPSDAALPQATAAAEEADELERPTLAGPVVAPLVDRSARRFYAARALTRGGRPGKWSTIRAVPTATVLGAPVAAPPTYNATTLALSWTPPPGARTAPAPPGDGLLASRPFGPAPVTTKYNVYLDAPESAADAFGLVTHAAPLNRAPIDALSVAVPGVTFDQERCFVVRSLDVMAGVTVESPASAPVCVTPRDTFPPPAPTALEAVGGAGVISLIWEAVEATDLAGYLVFRGEGGGEPTTPLTPAPIRDTSFEDRTVTPGVRYAYVVVAIDSATPANQSAPSNRAEETARQ